MCENKQNNCFKHAKHPHMFLYIPIKISVLMFDVSSLPAHEVKEKILFLVYLPTSSNQEADLSARGTWREQDPPAVVPIPAMAGQEKPLILALPVITCTTKHAKQ